MTQSSAPAKAANGTGAPWRVERRTGSGEYLVSHRSGLLGRLDRDSGCLFLWDKKLGGEVPIKISDLLALCEMAGGQG